MTLELYAIPVIFQRNNYGYVLAGLFSKRVQLDLTLVNKAEGKGILFPQNRRFHA